MVFLMLPKGPYGISIILYYTLWKIFDNFDAKCIQITTFSVKSHKKLEKWLFPWNHWYNDSFLRKSMYSSITGCTIIIWFLREIDGILLSGMASISSLGRKLKPNFDVIFWCIPLSEIYVILTNFFLRNQFIMWLLRYFDEIFGDIMKFVPNLIT